MERRGKQKGRDVESRPFSLPLLALGAAAGRALAERFGAEAHCFASPGTARRISLRSTWRRRGASRARQARYAVLSAAGPHTVSMAYWFSQSRMLRLSSTSSVRRA